MSERDCPVRRTSRVPKWLAIAEASGRHGIVINAMPASAPASALIGCATWFSLAAQRFCASEEPLIGSSLVCMRTAISLKHDWLAHAFGSSPHHLSSRLTQTLTGFGRPSSRWRCSHNRRLQVAAPLVALIAGTIELILLVHYRKALRCQPCGHRSCLCLGHPVGILALRQCEEKVVLTILGSGHRGLRPYML